MKKDFRKTDKKVVRWLKEFNKFIQTSDFIEKPYVRMVKKKTVNYMGDPLSKVRYYLFQVGDDGLDNYHWASASEILNPNFRNIFESRILYSFGELKA